MKINTILLSIILALLVWTHIGSEFGEAVRDYKRYKKFSRENHKFEHPIDENTTEYCDVGYALTFDWFDFKPYGYLYSVADTCFEKTKRH